MDIQGQTQRSESNGSTSLTVTTVPVAVPVTLQEWADRGTLKWQKTVADIIDYGQFLIEAKAANGHGNFAKLFKDDPEAVERPMPIRQHTAELLMRIARNLILSNPIHWSNLPSSYKTLSELSHLPAHVLQAHLALGAVHAELTRAEAIVLRGTPQPLPTANGKGRRVRPDSEHVARVEILQEDEVRLRQYATEIAEELRAPLQFSETGIASGVWWLQLIGPTVSRPPVHRCVCQTCGHTHADRNLRARR